MEVGLHETRSTSYTLAPAQRTLVGSRPANGLHPSYYGEQPGVRALIPFAVNETLARKMIRDLRPHVRGVVPATPAASSLANDRTLARLERFRNKKAVSEPSRPRSTGEAQE